MPAAHVLVSWVAYVAVVKHTSATESPFVLIDLGFARGQQSNLLLLEQLVHAPWSKVPNLRQEKFLSEFTCNEVTILTGTRKHYVMI